MCLTAQVPAQCPAGYQEEASTEIFLSSTRPRGPDCNGGGRGGGRHGNLGEESYLLPYGPNGESLLTHATPDDQPILDALMEAPEILDVGQLFDAIPAEHPMSFKLSKDLVKCMNGEDMSDVAELDCGDAELLKGCKTVQEGDANYDACLKKEEAKKNGKKCHSALTEQLPNAQQVTILTLKSHNVFQILIQPIDKKWYAWTEQLLLTVTER